MTLTYSGKSRPSARLIYDELVKTGDTHALNRGSAGNINWGRNYADTDLNPDISNATNKRVMRELFAEHDVPMPKLYGRNLSETGENWKFPIIGRPDHHMKGRGFWKINNFDDYARAIRGTRRKAAATHFMEYIPNAEHEYRVHIFKGKSIRISEKKYEDNDVPIYRKEYTTIKPTGNIKHVRKAAKAAIKALDLDFGAVDILATDDQCWVLEVNAAPGLGGTMPKLYAETFTKWEEGEL